MLEGIANLFQGFFLVKLGFLIVSGFYVAFLLVVFRQGHAMQKVIDDDGASGLINTVALINIVIGICLFVAALVIL